MLPTSYLAQKGALYSAPSSALLRSARPLVRRRLGASPSFTSVVVHRGSARSGTATTEKIGKRGTRWWMRIALISPLGIIPPSP